MQSNFINGRRCFLYQTDILIINAIWWNGTDQWNIGTIHSTNEYCKWVQGMFDILDESSYFQPKLPSNIIYFEEDTKNGKTEEWIFKKFAKCNKNVFCVHEITQNNWKLLHETDNWKDAGDSLLIKPSK